MPDDIVRERPFGDLASQREPREQGPQPQAA